MNLTEKPNTAVEVALTEQSRWYTILADRASVKTKAGHLLISADFPILPTAGLILAEEVIERETKKGALIIVQGNEKPLQTAKVLAVCAPFKTDSGQMHQPPFYPGQKIYYGQYQGRSLELDGNKFLLLHEKDIIGTANTKEKNEAK